MSFLSLSLGLVLLLEFSIWLCFTMTLQVIRTQVCSKVRSGHTAFSRSLRYTYVGPPSRNKSKLKESAHGWSQRPER